MTTTLLVTSRYRNGDVDWAPGRIESCTDAQAEALLRDSPGSFQEVDPAALEAAEAVRVETVNAAYGVTAEPEPEPEPEPEDAADEAGGIEHAEPTDDLEGLSIAELREIASDEDIDITGRRARADIADAISAARGGE